MLLIILLFTAVTSSKSIASHLPIIQVVFQSTFVSAWFPCVCVCVCVCSNRSVRQILKVNNTSVSHLLTIYALCSCHISK